MSSHYYSASGDLVPGYTKGAYPSPSTILDIYKNEGILAFRARIGEEAADLHMVEAQERGTRVHKACELWANSGDYEASANEALLKDGEWAYLDGFINWWEKYRPTLVKTEMFLENETLKYRGRTDLIVVLDGTVWVIDLKTGATRVKHGLQIKFYQAAYLDMVKRGLVQPVPGKVRMAGLYVDKTRTCGYRYFRSPYGLLEYTESLATIKHHLMVFRWQQKKEPGSFGLKAPVEGEAVWKD